MKKYLEVKRMVFLKIIIVQIIFLLIPFSDIRADKPEKEGTRIFYGYDIYSTTIIKEGSTWKQWFAGWMTSSDLPWDRIYYSVSTDSGTTWSIPVLAFTITNVQVNDPTVLRLWDPVNSGYYYLMYYTYYPSGLGDPTNYIAASASLDGVNWTHKGVLIGAENGIDKDGAWSPSAYSFDSIGSDVSLYFHNNHPDGRIFRTTLTNNGLTFDKTTTISVTSPGGLRANPDISRSNDGKWWMFYNGSSLTSNNKGNFNTRKMYSNDGVNWNESALNPIQEYSTMTTCTPYVLWTSDSTYQLWYGYGTPTFMDFSVYRQNYTCESEPVMPVVASSEALSVMNPAKVIDNNPATFWSSAGHVGSAVYTEWIYLNLGAIRDISQVVLTPRVVSGAAMCFPVDFKLQESTDGINWADIRDQNYTNFSCDTLAQKFLFSNVVTTKYVRLYATKLSADSFGNYYCQISEMSATSIYTSVEDKTSGVPDEFSLMQNYPNPFNSSTTIKYTVPHKSIVSLKVFDLLGKEVACLVEKSQSAGNYQIKWDGVNNKGETLKNGYYFAILSASGRNVTKKVLITK